MPPAAATPHPRAMMRDMRPVPDPTVLTTQQLQREIAMSREFVEARISGFKEVLETRLDGMDKAIRLLESQTDEFPLNVDKTVVQLKGLVDEKFQSVEKQFVERDTRTEATQRDNKVAIDAALKAAGDIVAQWNLSNTKAIDKSELSFTKQIDQIGILISTLGKNLDEKINLATLRIAAIESIKKGGSDTLVVLFAGLGALVGIAGVGVAIAAIFFKH
jgi:hypothetical protein